jgi:hypothetical protein
MSICCSVAKALVACGWVAIMLAATPAHADRMDDALALIPADALSAVVIPNPKQASDELQQGIERMGRAETAMGGRPIDLIRAQLGIGAGFDDKGILVAWSQAAAQGVSWFGLIPVTDAEAFIQSTLVQKEGASPPGADGPYTFGADGPQVFARAVGNHVLVTTDTAGLGAYSAGTGLGGVLVTRLNARGQAVARMGEVLLWARPEALKQMSAAIPEGDAAFMQQIADLVITADFDAMGIGLRSYIRFQPESELAKAARSSAADSASPAGSATTAAPSMLVNCLPGGRFYMACGIDVQRMGGVGALRKALQALPMGNQLPIPAWFDAVQDKIQGVQMAMYPSKLAVLTGGLFNDSALVLKSQDPGALKSALKDWIMAQQGESAGMKIEATWEDARELKDGSHAAAFAVKESVLKPAEAGGTAYLMAKQVMVGARGLHGFAVELPNALVVTLSQRTDVLDRALKAARLGASPEAASGTLAAAGLIKSYAPWLMPSPDAVMFVGMGELMGAVQQVAASFPGGAEIQFPESEVPVEPIGGAFRSSDGAWETALIVPSTVMGLGFDAAMQQMMRRVQGSAPPSPPAREQPVEP